MRSVPYPIEITSTGAGGGRFMFDHFDQPVSLSAPGHSVDLPGAG
jgi:hypothetical protein